MESSDKNEVRFRFEPGDIVGDRYDVMKRLGAGGMSQVYRVRDKLLGDNQIALKLLLPAERYRNEFEERLRNEVILARRLGHPNIVRVYDYGVLVSGESFITMEFIEGKTILELEESFPEYRFPLDQAVKILLDVATALEYAHKNGVIHRDLKPENVFLTPRGDVKLVDFGAAIAMHSSKRITRPGGIIGTPGYMAPEQFAGKQLDGRVDMYAFGLMAYEMTTGVPPVVADNDVATALSKMQQEFSRLNYFPMWFRTVVETCTEVEADKRFRDMSEVRKIIERGLETLTPTPAAQLRLGGKGISHIIKRMSQIIVREKDPPS